MCRGDLRLPAPSCQAHREVLRQPNLPRGPFAAGWLEQPARGLIAAPATLSEPLRLRGTFVRTKPGKSGKTRQNYSQPNPFQSNHLGGKIGVRQRPRFFSIRTKLPSHPPALRNIVPKFLATAVAIRQQRTKAFRVPLFACLAARYNFFAVPRGNPGPLHDRESNETVRSVRIAVPASRFRTLPRLRCTLVWVRPVIAVKLKIPGCRGKRTLLPDAILDNIWGVFASGCYEQVLY